MNEQSTDKQIAIASEKMNPGEVMQRTKYVDIYRRCIESDAFTRTKDDIFPFDISADKLKPILDIFIDDLKADTNNISEEIDKIDIPTNFDFAAEVKSATQKTITILHTYNIVDLQTLRGASRYTGPGNTHIIPEDINSYFRPTDEYREFKETIGKSTFDKFDMPYPPQGRNAYFRIEMGGKGLKFKAAEHIKTAKNIGIELSVEDALRLETTKEAAHEYGHAVNRALLQKGIMTFERAKTLNLLRDAEFLDLSAEEINDEHLARGIEEAVQKHYMRDYLGWSEKNINYFMTADTKDRYFKSEAAYAFFKYAKSKGYTPNEIIKLQNAVILRAEQMYPEGVYLWHLSDIISYHTKPYSEDDLKILLKNNIILSERS